MQYPVIRRFLMSSLAAASMLAWISGTSVAAPAPSGPNPQLEQVIVVFKTHFDIGYTDLASNVVDRYRTSMIDKALAACDASRDLPPEHRFVWTLPGWPMAQLLWPGQEAARKKRIEEAIRQGQLVWHALPATTHTESLDLEDFVRGTHFSSQLSRRFEMPLPRDAKMTDVPSHTWMVPTVLKHAGVEFLHLGCNSASGSPEIPRLFWWEGPDGSRVLTMYEASGYGSGIHPPKDWPHRTWLGLIHTGDNKGPPKPDEVNELLDKARRELPGVKIRMGRLSDFSDAILAEKPKLPVIRGDMPDTWIHGLMSMPTETQEARHLRLQTGALENLSTLLGAWGVKVPDPAATVADAYEGTLMFGEHTWGYSMSPFGYHYGKDWAAKRAEGHYQRLEKSWAEKGAWVHNAQAKVEPVLAQKMTALAQAVNVEGPRIVVFNPLPWGRDGVVSVNVPAGRFPALKVAGGDETVPFEFAVDKKTMRFVARDMPPMGYRTYVPAAEAAVGDQQADNPLVVNQTFAAITNGRLDVYLDLARGAVLSMIDRQSGRQFINWRSKYKLGQYLYERFDEKDIRRYFDEYLKYVPGWSPHFARGNMPPSDQAPHSVSSPGDFQLRFERGEVSVSAVMTSTKCDHAQCVSLRVTLYRDQPFVDLTWTITGKKPDQWPEAGWLCLPLAADKPTYRLGRLGSIVDPAKDMALGSNFDVFCLNNGMTVSGSKGAGIGICPIDSPLVSIGHPGLYRHTGRMGDRKPDLFVNLFNNVWGTNFQQWTEGSWSSSVRLWAATGRQGRRPNTSFRSIDNVRSRWSLVSYQENKTPHVSSTENKVEADLLTPSWEARAGCIAAVVDGPAGKLPPTQAGLTLSRKGVLVTSFGHNPDGGGTLLRLWEQSGQSGPCTVQLPKGFRAETAQPCDLRGRAQATPIPVQDSSFDVPLKQFAPLSLVLQ